MAHITVSNLNFAGSDLFASADSFLTELQDTDTAQIRGGKGGSKKKKSGYGYGCGYGYGYGSGTGKGGHGGYCYTAD
jgi:hypothetical protein